PAGKDSRSPPRGPFEILRIAASSRSKQHPGRVLLAVPSSANRTCARPFCYLLPAGLAHGSNEKPFPSSPSVAHIAPLPPPVPHEVLRRLQPERSSMPGSLPPPLPRSVAGP